MPKQISKRKERKEQDIRKAHAKKKSKCNVCWEIIQAFKKFSKHEPKLWNSVTLGSYDEVMQMPECDIHPRIFKACFGKLMTDSIENQVIRSIECRVEYNLASFYKNTATRSEGTDRMICLMSVAADKQDYRRGKVVHPQWIDHNMLRRWRQACDSQKNEDCQMPITYGRLKGHPPTWLVDTWQLCLIPGSEQMSYVALSYVWGITPFFQTTVSNLASLQTRHALQDSNQSLGLPIPRTIVDAFSVTQIIGERYLWIDRLCIVQDDYEMKAREIQNMGSIFANASITIIARQGEDASYGLRGLRGISQPRSTSQELFPLSKSVTFLKPCDLDAYDGIWNTRGWTYQEEVFARRTLSFHRDRVWWTCMCSCFAEDLEPRQGYVHHTAGLQLLPCHRNRASLTSEIPDLAGYQTHVSIYNDKELTNPEDVEAGFAGITNVLSFSFPYGFLRGLPILFFDMALCWQPWSSSLRRRPRVDTVSARTNLPSWSWIGWKTSLDNFSWIGNYSKFGFSSRSSWRIVSSVQWSSRAVGSTEFHPIVGPQLLQRAISECQKDGGWLPSGWQRLEDKCGWHSPHAASRFPGDLPWKYVFKHDSRPTEEFWHPVPTCRDVPATSHGTENDSLLFCRTLRISLTLNNNCLLTLPNRAPKTLHSLYDSEHKWIGIVQSTAEAKSMVGETALKWMQRADEIACELVMISEGFAIEGGDRIDRFIEEHLDEWKLDERPKGPDGTKYEYYNVLWVEWEDGIAYRKGCGRVIKSAWEAQNPEWIDLILG